MTKKKRKINSRKLKKVLPYFLVGALTLVLVAVGSLDKNNTGVTLSLDVFAKNDNVISRREGIVMICIFIAYYAYLFLQ